MTTALTPPRDKRFETPRYTVREAARMLDVPPGTFSKWVDGYAFKPKRMARPVVGRPVISAEPRRPGAAGRPRLTFAGLTEGMVIEGLRRSGAHFTEIRRIAAILRRDMNDDWALASKRLLISGADVLWNHAERYDDLEAAELTVFRSGQRVFTEAVREYLARIEYEDDEYAVRLWLPITPERIIAVDPYRNFGDPTFRVGGASVGVVLGRLRAGDDMQDLARDYGLPIEHIRAAYKSFGQAG